MVIFSFCTSTTATPPSLLLLSSPHKHTSDLLVSPSASSSSSSPLAASETSSHQEFSVSPPINTLLFFPCPPPPHHHHQRGASSVQLQHPLLPPPPLLPSHPSLPSRPIASPPPLKHTSNQYEPNQEREGMPSTSHAAPAGRKKPFVIALSLSLFLSPLFLGLHFCQATAATASLLSLSSRFLSLSLSLSRCVFLGMRGWGVAWRCFLPSLKENGSSLPLSLFFNKAIFHHLHSMCKQNREYEKKKKKTP